VKNLIRSVITVVIAAVAYEVLVEVARRSSIDWASPWEQARG